MSDQEEITWELGEEDPRVDQLLQQIKDHNRDQHHDSHMTMMEFSEDLQELYEALEKSAQKKINDLQRKWRPAFRFVRTATCTDEQARQTQALDDLLRQLRRRAELAEAMGAKFARQMSMFPAQIEAETSVRFTREDVRALREGSEALREA